MKLLIIEIRKIIALWCINLLVKVWPVSPENKEHTTKILNGSLDILQAMADDASETISRCKVSKLPNN
jgi:hypothetical protein